MSDDLISRSALIEKFSKNSAFSHITNVDGKNVLEIIQEAPCAFDTERIVEQIKNMMETTDEYRHRVCGTLETENCTDYKWCEDCIVDQIIKLLKLRGVENE